MHIGAWELWEEGFIFYNPYYKPAHFKSAIKFYVNRPAKIELTLGQSCLR
jgi:hypothetical protein